MDIKTAREMMQLSQWRLAREARISKTTVWRAENGFPISRMSARAIARALNVAPESLIELKQLFVTEERIAPNDTNVQEP